MDKRREYLINFATDATVKILQRRQLPFVLCGELARSKHIGSNTPPFKVEIMVISRNTVLDELKQSIVREQPTHFSLRAMGILRFRDYTLPSGGQRSVDVDFTLFTTTHYLDRIHTVDGFPLAPYPYILLRKLEDWEKVKESPEGDLIKLEQSLSRDIIAMLKQYNVQKHTPPGGPFDPALRDASVERVARFYAAYPKLKHDWRRLGFTQITSPDGAVAPLSSPPLASGSTPKVHLKAETPRAPPIHQAEPLPSPAPPPSTTAAVPSPPSAVKQPRKRRPLVSRTQVRNMAAKAAVSTLQELGIPCVIFGSMGCRMFGNNRPPNDVDVLLLPPPGDMSTQEDFKAAMVARDPVHFFLRDSKDPEATYKVLHYRLGESMKKDTSKVDILLPGVMHLPALSREAIVWQRRGENVLPVLPFSVLLLQKIQGWDDHRKAVEERYTEKAPVDVMDLANMLRMRHVQPLMRSQPWSDRTLFSEEFEQLSRERVVDFCAEFPEHRQVWERLGFQTEVLRTGVMRFDM